MEQAYGGGCLVVYIDHGIDIGYDISESGTPFVMSKTGYTEMSTEILKRHRPGFINKDEPAAL